MGRSDTSARRKTRWHIWRITGADNWVGLPLQEGDTAEEAIERAVENEIRLHPVAKASGMYFACPEDMLTRRDWAVQLRQAPTVKARGMETLMPLSEPLSRLVSWLASLSEGRQQPESPPTPVEVHLHGEMTEAKVRQIVRDEVRRASQTLRP